MTNEEKILSMLEKMQIDIEELKTKFDISKLETPEEKKMRQLETFRNFVNSKTDAEEPEATAEFFKIMDAEEARKAAF